MRRLYLMLLQFVLLTAGTELKDFTTVANFADGLESKNAELSGSFSGLSGNNSVIIESTTKSLARALDFYNNELLNANWNLSKNDLSPTCRTDMEKYIKGLKTAEIWALKMEDASGRYSTGWFWGNQYWVGSQTLCENIIPKERNVEVKDVKKENLRKQRDAALPMKRDFSPSQPSGYKNGGFNYQSIPPFHVSFFIMRIAINASITPEERTIHVGLCLPTSCAESDVQSLVEETTSTLTSLVVRVEAVRSRHNIYNFWKDNTFLVLSMVTFAVVVLLIAGTFYDIHLMKRDTQKKISQYVTPKEIKLDISIADKTSKQGKSRHLVINNNNNEQTEENSIEPKKNNISLGTLCKDLLLSFSLRINVKNICDQSVGSDTIPVLHGLKSISMMWVILGHTCIVAFKYSDNMEYRKLVQKEFIFQTITNGAFSVDTFFFVSGLLVSFLYFRTNAKGKLEKLTQGYEGCTSGLFHFLGLLAYRFARLTAPYLYVLGVVEVSMRWFKYNSVFEVPSEDDYNCHQYWWRNILYINTLFPVEEMCMLWSWYLSDDTQFYIIGAIILIIAARHWKSATAMLTVCLLSSWLTTGYIAFSNSHMPNSDDPLALFDKIYDKPWTRIGPYLIGMCVGWILFRTDCKIKMTKLAVAVGWLMSAACLLSLVYGLYEVNLSPLMGAAYSSMSHSVWALGLAWVVIACTTGYGGYANSILSAPILYPLSRVTYCAYLIHPMVIRFVSMSSDSPIHLSKALVVVVFLGQAIASYGLGFFISVAFEAPVVSMLRILTKLTPNKK